MSKGNINLFNNDDPVTTVLRIVNIVAVDAPISQVTRLINTYQQFMSCTRRKDERISLFASRFRGLAGKHLRYCGASASSQTGQVLAITLLNNARLDEVVLTNAKMQLISLAQDRAEKDAPNLAKAKIDPDTLEPAVVYANEFKDKCYADAEKTINGKRKVRISFLDEIKEGSEQLVEMLENARTSATDETTEDSSLEDLFKEKGSVISINLDDAVTVLRNIAQGPSSKPMFSMADVTTMVQEQVKAYLSHHSGASALADAPPLGSSSRGSKRRKPNGNGNGKGSSHASAKKRDNKPGDTGKKRRLNDLIPDADDHCLDCGSKDHRRGANECKSPSWGTKKIKEKKEKESDSQGFRGGSAR